MFEMVVALLEWIGILSIEARKSKRKTDDNIVIGCAVLAIIILLASFGYLIVVRFIL